VEQKEKKIAKGSGNVRRERPKFSGRGAGLECRSHYQTFEGGKQLKKKGGLTKRLESGEGKRPGASKRGKEVETFI